MWGDASKRRAGVLMPVFSLVSRYGIGDFGDGADSFLDWIASMGFSVWQVLPLTTIGLGNSPYSGVSAFAGNPLLIAPNRIPNHLIWEHERKEFEWDGSPYQIDYARVKEAKTRLLCRAFSRLTDADKEQIALFCKQNANWINDYALYMALKDENDGAPFTQWEKGLKFRDGAAMKAATERLKDPIAYYQFEQYEFFRQWQLLKASANSRGIEIFGDIPIYVAEDSVDVWAHGNLFVLDKNRKKTAQAGVPPDYFAKDGQLWGNPLYRYSEMKKDNYAWWVSRLQHNLQLYDILRLDHFRAFYQYWAVPKGAATAKEGKWKNGPKMELFDALKKRVKNPKIVAEDLGMIDKNVLAFREQTGFPGMRVLQFAFDGDPTNLHLPFHYDKNSVAYTATHDNDTSLGWFFALDQAGKEGVLSYLEIEENWGQGGGQAPVPRAMAKEVLASVAALAIVPFQDMAGYGTNTRMNIPGVGEGNWTVRETTASRDEVDAAYYLHLNRKYGRTER